VVGGLARLNQGFARFDPSGAGRTTQSEGT
jgi:hypothetical protein